MSSNGPILGAIEFGSQQWFWPAIAVFALGLILLIISYSFTKASPGFKGLLILLKASGIGLLALCLLNPTLVQKQFRPGENILVMLTDNSASMQIEESQGTTRSDSIKELIEDDNEEWLTRLTQDFQLRKFSFDDRINPFENFDSLTFDGNRSQLAAAMKSIQVRFRNQPLSGLLLFTDGNASDLEQLRDLELNVPIYPVIKQEHPQPQFDLAIENVTISESPFEDAPIEVAATLSTTSDKDVVAHVTLIQEELQDLLITTENPESTSEDELDLKADPENPEVNQLHYEQTVTIPASKPEVVRFQLKPSHRGIGFYRIEVVTEDVEQSFTEATLFNNERLITIDRGDTKNRILYVGGRPNWEYKFFNRALSEDREVKLVSLIRIARKEAKFDFRGRVGETGNSLFRGQDREADEETESYDEAVLIRLNTLDEKELSDGFPKSKKDLYQYDAIILDDVEAKFFTPDQQALLDKFVSERGGGLMMLGGRDSFRHGQWQKTPMRDVTPVYLDRSSQPPEGAMRWNLTRAGWLEPWMRVRPTESEEKTRLTEIPTLELLNALPNVKPGARVFAEIEDERGENYPAVVAHTYGQGRSIAVLVGDLWRWSIQRKEGETDDLAKVWRQVIRWLVTEVPQKLSTELEWENLGSTSSVTLNVRLRDEEYLPKENANVTVTVQSPDGKLVKLVAEPSLAETGLFEATYIPRETGSYLAEVEVKDETEFRSKMKVGWTSQPQLEEFKQVEMNSSILKTLAERSGGEVIAFDQLPQFVRSLPQKEMPVQETKTTPLWHSPFILLLALSCFAAEWGLRRWRGLS